MIGLLVFDIVVGLIQGALIWWFTGHIWLSIGMATATIFMFMFVQGASILRDGDKF